MATTPQWVDLQNSMRIEFAHTHLHTTPKCRENISIYTRNSSGDSQTWLNDTRRLGKFGYLKVVMARCQIRFDSIYSQKIAIRFDSMIDVPTGRHVSR